ncbi:6-PHOSPHOFRUCTOKINASE (PHOSPHOFRUCTOKINASE) (PHOSPHOHEXOKINASE) [Mycoplasmopsis pulmonis]|uniref:ATP-dependent 6-phosphofructokinase n=1 Tax=Mycoplasmopsis pulmonis (strain UAB CTIP) TaxID=272635 RepID=PFKA_MYCPU|nr:6-phosphofructokinase [Mycoplasmopsis pulmonis]Q98PW8.1 RecName: Full=ATP-dependent 6-phosphofructokinase; Short=ATP-PFK; Short=Phosphofructokinase; AltName: Full=Phosphohexokinase [Mycoplasmopsis pulmonis UAB CTIP]MDZ7293598.1 6-phosphofructokinase [Mycoplasmopsis pulmonis]CAC13774.1 6-PHOSPHOFRUCTOKINASE (PHOSPHOFRUCTOKINASE) (PHOSPHOHEXOKINASE) [Mycoplasmopsis pulmonis]VEU68362.1 6-phosphofructokinase [Mycoplasmopsis pulmonis]
MIKKIAILTSGGDSPGMNNAIRAIIKTARLYDIETYLVYEGFLGLYNGWIKPSEGIDEDSYINKGGTFIFSARFVEFAQEKYRQVAKENLLKLGIEALVVIGGDGSYKGAQKLHEMGIKTIALPGTIDNDITSSDFTIGYDTALNTIVEAVDKIRDTASSHKRCIMVEVMGHGASDLALYSGMATGSEIIVSNDYKLSVEEMAKIVKKQFEKPNKRSVIITVSEFVFKDLQQVAKQIEELTNITTKAVVLAHIQRGGYPSARERINATILGKHAVLRLKQGQSGIALGLIKNQVAATPILEALAMPQTRKDLLERRTKSYNDINQA